MGFLVNKTIYTSFKDDFLNDFLKPNIRKANSYKRISGYFTSNFIDMIYDEVITASNKNEFKIKIICSPQLTQEDQRKIQQGYDYRNIIEKNIIKSIKDISYTTENLAKISELIMNNILDIRFAINTNGTGIFHAKIGVLENIKGEKIGFNGSNNETTAAIKNNFEITQIINDIPSLIEYNEIFDILWSNEEPNVYTFEPTESVINSFKNFAQSNKKTKSILDHIDLYEYQEEAVKKWEDNNYKGMLEMATGTGKTITALACHDKVLSIKNNLITFIIVPQLDLLSQWSEEVAKLGIKIIKCSSHNPRWQSELKLNLFKHDSPFLVMTTEATFRNKPMQNIITNNLQEEAMIIADEVHGFGSERSRETYELVQKKFKYRLGISATPFRRDENETEELILLFEGIVYTYNLKDAIENGYLNNYLYHPVILSFNDIELHKYRGEINNIFETKKRKNVLKDIENITSTIVNSSTGKIAMLEELLRENGLDTPKIVYCSPGNYNDGQSRYDERHIDYVSSRIGNLGCRLRKVNSQVPIAARDEILEQFKIGDLDTLVAVKCLDQGVNLKTVTHAYILSSTDNPTEFIQRRGRILRVYENKPVSEIFDLIMLPENIYDSSIVPEDEDAYLVLRELKRLEEYNDAAVNKNENYRVIRQIKEIYEGVIKNYEERR